MTKPALQAVYDRALAVDLKGLLNLGRASPEDGILIIAPHPDDESLGCGGLIASAATEGARVEVAMLTGGEGSHPNSKKYPPARLSAVRRQETLDALGLLSAGESRVTFLQLEDGGVPASGPSFEDTVARLFDLCRQRRVTTLFSTSGLDPHPDHKAAFAIASALRDHLPGAVLWAYPIWSWTLDSIAGADDLRGCRLDISQYTAIKRSAIHAHASQVSGLIDDDPDGFRLDPRFISRFIEPYELFIAG